MAGIKTADRKVGGLPVLLQCLFAFFGGFAFLGFLAFLGRLGVLGGVLFFLFFYRIRTYATGGGSVIGGIESRTFEHNTHRRNDLLQASFAAFRTNFERCIGVRLLAVELDPAGFTTISVDRHYFLLTSNTSRRIRL